MSTWMFAFLVTGAIGGVAFLVISLVLAVVCWGAHRDDVAAMKKFDTTAREPNATWMGMGSEFHEGW